MTDNSVRAEIDRAILSCLDLRDFDPVIDVQALESMIDALLARHGATVLLKALILPRAERLALQRLEASRTRLQARRDRLIQARFTHLEAKMREGRQ